MLNILFFIIVIYIFATFGGKFNSGYKQKIKLSLEEAEYMVALLAKVAKSDGRVDEIEAELIKQTLDDLARKVGGGELTRNKLKFIYNKEKERQDDAFMIARKYKSAFNLSKQKAFSLIYFFLNLAYIDGKFNDDEKKIISEICNGFGVSDYEQTAIFSQFQRDFYQTYGYGAGSKNSYANYNDGYYDANYGYRKNTNSSGGYYRQNSQNTQKSQEKDPYEILDVSKNANFNEIKKKYRELVKKYHPDILMGQGANDSVIREGTKKLQEINAAYEKLRAKFE